MGCGGAGDKGSSLTVTNGTTIDNSKYPEVVIIYDAVKKALCTGTFIADDTVLTAAHCTMGSSTVDPTTGAVSDLSLTILRLVKETPKTMAKVASSTAVFRNPLWDGAEKQRAVNPYDLGIVKFPSGTSSAVAQMASSSPSVGSPLTIVGYGLNFIPSPTDTTYDHSSSGIKRVGTNRIGQVEGGFIGFKGQGNTTTDDGTDVASSHGDSGGPMFVDGQLVGVTSGGGLDADGQGVSLYIDLNSDISRNFLQGMMSVSY